MNSPEQVQGAIDELQVTPDIARQRVLLGFLRQVPGFDYWNFLSRLCSVNPFLELAEGEPQGLASIKGYRDLFALRQQAAATPGRRICVFCMPKSGSSFTQSAIQTALNIPYAMLTSTATNSSWLGMNGREQELDEMAVIAAILGTGGEFVAQHHTRCTPYLCRQLHFFGLRPVVTVRNVFDAMVSFDDMMVSWRKANQAPAGLNWAADAQFPLPLGYADMAAEARLTLLARTFGVWLVNFYLSWKRCERASLVAPLWLRYETDIAGKRTFPGKVGHYLNLDENQAQHLANYAENPDAAKSRINKGIAGRGQAVPEPAKRELIDFARPFKDELDDGDMSTLFGDPGG